MILSIIIPVYNIRDYLPQCIESLLCNRTDYEILLIDDGSTDGSSDICDAYANKYDIIKVFHKENGGVSSARNLGLQHASGEYIYFVDGDDWVDGFNTVFNYLNGSELFGVNYDIIDSYNEIRKSHQISLNTININDYDHYYERHSHALWAFIFRKDMIEQLKLTFHEELKYAEDWAFVVQYLSNCKVIQNIHTVSYKYRVSRIGSAMNQKYDRQQVLLHFKAFDFINAINPLKENQVFYHKERAECFIYVLNLVANNIALLNKQEVQAMIRRRLSLSLLSTFKIKFVLKSIIASIDIQLIKLHYRRKPCKNN